MTTTLPTIRIGSALAMIVGVFMPWITIFDRTLFGHEILRHVGGIQEFGRVLGGRASTEALLLYLPLVILILATITILTEIAASPETKRIDAAGLITGVVPFIGLAYFLNLTGQQGFWALEVGSHWILLAASILFIASFDHGSASGETSPDKDTIETGIG